MNRTELDSANSSFSAEIETPQTSKLDSTPNFGLESERYGHFMMCVSKGSRETYNLRLSRRLRYLASIRTYLPYE